MSRTTQLFCKIKPDENASASNIEMSQCVEKSYESICKPVSVCLARMQIKKEEKEKIVSPEQKRHSPKRTNKLMLGYKRRKRSKRLRRVNDKKDNVRKKNDTKDSDKPQNLAVGIQPQDEQRQYHMDVLKILKQPIIKLHRISISTDETFFVKENLDERQKNEIPGTVPLIPLEDYSVNNINEEALNATVHSSESTVSISKHIQVPKNIDEHITTRKYRERGNVTEWKFKRKRTISSGTILNETKRPTKVKRTNSLSHVNKDAVSAIGITGETTVSKIVSGETLSHANSSTKSYGETLSDRVAMETSESLEALSNESSSKNLSNELLSKTRIQQKSERKKSSKRKNSCKIFFRNLKRQCKQDKQSIKKMRQDHEKLNSKDAEMMLKGSPSLSPQKILEIPLTRFKNMKCNTIVTNWRIETTKETSDLIEPPLHTVSDDIEATKTQNEVLLESHVVCSVDNTEKDAVSIESIKLNLQESSPKSTQIQTVADQILQTDEDILQRHGITKKPKVFLLKLDNLGISLDTEYSASEIQRLTIECIISLLNTDSTEQSDRSTLKKLLHSTNMALESGSNNKESIDDVEEKAASVSCNVAQARRSFSISKVSKEVFSDSQKNVQESKKSTYTPLKRTRTPETAKTPIVISSKKVSASQVAAKTPPVTSSKKVSPSPSKKIKERVQAVSVSRNLSEMLQDVSPKRKSEQVSNERSTEQSTLSSTSETSDLTQQLPSPRSQTSTKERCTTPEAAVIQSNENTANSTQTPRKTAITIRNVLSPKVSLPSIHISRVVEPSNETLVKSPPTVKSVPEPSSTQSDISSDDDSRELVVDDSPSESVEFDECTSRTKISKTATSSDSISLSKTQMNITSKKDIARVKNLEGHCNSVNNSIPESERITHKRGIDDDLPLNLVLPKNLQKAWTKKYIHKHKNSVVIYKCIVCDRIYKDYFALQRHLGRHTKKQNNASRSSEKTFENTVLSTSQEEQNKTSESTKSTSSASPKTVDPIPSSSAENAESKKQFESPQSQVINEGCIKSKNLRHAFAETDSTDYNTCSKVAQTKTHVSNVAKQIYTHTENELQKTQEIACTDMNLTDNQSEQQRHDELNKESQREGVVLTGETRNQALTCDNENVGQERTEDSLESSKEKVQNETVETAPTYSTQEDTNRGSTSSKPIDEETNKQRTCQVATTGETRETAVSLNKNTIVNKAVQGVKPVSVCECHKNVLITKNCLRIEVVLLCHVCRILFRSMECFETHYNLPAHVLCNQNRIRGTSPKLFCTGCCIIFCSIQDVRQHLEMHARTNQNGRTDFRCNICKVIFIGMGSLFYIHWSNHIKDPLFVANQLSFPKTSIVNSKLARSTISSNDKPESYIHVAEHVCRECKMPFNTNTDLTKHETECSKSKNISGNSKVTDDVINKAPKEQQITKMRLVCSICKETFPDVINFNEHVKKYHVQPTEPQNVCVSLTTIKNIYICNICSNPFTDVMEFTKHWATHNSIHESYICMRCLKQFDTWEIFIQHSAEHKNGSNVEPASCKVIYRKPKYVCVICKASFTSQTDFNTHVACHTLPNWSNTDKLQLNSDLAAQPVSNVSKSIQLENLEQNAPQQSSAIKPGNLDKQTKGTERINVSQAFNQCDKNNLQNDVLENIDCSGRKSTTEFVNATATNYHEEIRQGQERIDNVTKFTVPNPAPCTETSQTGNDSSGVTSVEQSHNKDTNFKYVICPNTIKEQVEKEPRESSYSNDKNDTSNNVAVANLPSTSQQQPALSRNDSPPRVRLGFLRVKTLAELTGRTHACSTCEHSFGSEDELKQHSLVHRAQPEVEVVAEIPKKNLHLQYPTYIPIQENSFLTEMNRNLAPVPSTIQAPPRPASHLLLSTPLVPNPPNTSTPPPRYITVPICQLIRPIRPMRPIRPRMNQNN